MKARLLLRFKEVFSDGAIAQARAWSVERTTRTPDGLKYSLVYISPEGKRILGYDNSEGKGHHRHFRGKEERIEFASLDALIERFSGEVEKLRRTTT